MTRSTAPRRPSGPLPPRALLGALALGLLAGCGSDDDSSEDAAGPTNGQGAGAADVYAFVSGATPTFDAGQVERLLVGDDVAAAGSFASAGSDIRVATDGRDVYEIGRGQLETLTRYAPDDLAAPVWQYSLADADEDGASNPYDVAFLNAERAYVVRYGSPTAWIVNPSADTEANFRIGELDLSAYDDDAPNASDVAIVDGKVFVLMQRLEEFAPTRQGYLAVFDTAEGDAEIDTGMGEDGLLGIALGVTNPEGLQYVESTDELLVTGRGNLFANDTVEGDAYQGGVVAVDPTTYETDLLVDDGTAGDNIDFVQNSLVATDGAGYLITYRLDVPGDFDTAVNTLRRFDPVLGTVAEDAVPGLEGEDLSFLALGPRGRVWVGTTGPDGDEPGFALLDPATDAIVGRVGTEFNPNDVAFVPVPEGAVDGTDDVDDPEDDDDDLGRR